MTERVVYVACVILIASAVAGCKRARFVGHFDDDAFYHVRDHYRVRYRAGDGRLLPPGWRIVNYERDGETERPTVAVESDAFVTHYAVDHGRRGTRQVRAESVDLRFEHEEFPAMMWARTVPTSETWAEAPLAMMLRDAVRGLSTGAPAGLDLVGQPLAPGHALDAELLEDGDAVVDGLSARWARFDLRNRDTRAVDRFTVVMLRPGENRWRYRRYNFPMLVVLGYVSRPARHAALRPVFESFVSRVDVAGP